MRTSVRCDIRGGRGVQDRHGGNAGHGIRCALEKSYRMWGSDLTPDTRPSKLGSTACTDEQGIVHRQGGARETDGPRRSEPLRDVRSAWRDRCDPLGNEPLFDGKGDARRRATAGYYGHALKKSLGLGYVEAGIRQGGHRARDPDSRRAKVRDGTGGFRLMNPENKDLRA